MPTIMASITSLTPAQLQVLKADILADPAFAGWYAEEIAQAYNQQAQPAWYVWKSYTSAAEFRDAILGGGGAQQLDGLTASKRDSLLWSVSTDLNTGNPTLRAALDDFCGSQNLLKAAIQAAQKRPATRAEKLFATGTGSQVSPATLGWEGWLTYQDVEAALAA